MRLARWTERRLVTHLTRGCRVVVIAALVDPGVGGAQTRASAPDSLSKRPRVEVFGQLVTDAIYDFKRVDPDFYDVLRPSRLPAFEEEFGGDGHTYFSVRPSRVGTRITWPTKIGEARGIFDWDLFGSDGRTSFNLVRAYFQLGNAGAGQYDSPFMDIDVFPNSIEYWGPNAILFFRNVQLRYMPIQGRSRVTIALERPGASGDRNDINDVDEFDDLDDFGDRIDLASVIGRYPWPDLSAEGRLGREWGYVELAGILRGIYWDDLLRTDTLDLSGRALGWGVTLSSNVKTSKRDVLKLQITYGEAIQSYLDAPFDIGVALDLDDRRRPLRGVALPVFAGLAFLDHSWTEKLTTSVGWSGVRVTNSDGQSDLAFHTGQYALANLLYSPAPDLLVGGELQWGRRGNARDGFHSNDFRVQFTARLNYSVTIMRDKEKDDGK